MAGWNNFFTQPIQNVQQQNNSVLAVPVDSEESVGMYPVARGNTVILYNQTFTKIWLKSTDFNGFPQPIRAFDVVEIKQQNNPTEKFVTVKDFQKMQEALNALITKIENSTSEGSLNNDTTNNAVIAKSANVSTEI